MKYQNTGAFRRRRSFMFFLALWAAMFSLPAFAIDLAEFKHRGSTPSQITVRYYGNDTQANPPARAYKNDVVPEETPNVSYRHRPGADLLSTPVGGYRAKQPPPSVPVVATRPAEPPKREPQVYTKRETPSYRQHGGGCSHLAHVDPRGDEDLRIAQAIYIKYGDVFEEQAKQHNVDCALAIAIARKESAGMECTTSAAGARGLMQLMPATAAKHGVTNRCDAKQNVAGGIREMRDLFRKFGDDLHAVLGGYNAGPAIPHANNPETNYFRMVVLRTFTKIHDARTQIASN